MSLRAPPKALERRGLRTYFSDSVFKGVIVKLYRIVRRDGAWHVYCGEPEHSVAALKEKDNLIALARQLARKHDGEVHVFDADGKLEAVHRFHAGRESTRRPPKLRIVGPATG